MTDTGVMTVTGHQTFLRPDRKMFLTVGQLVSRPCSQLEFAESGRKENVREA